MNDLEQRMRQILLPLLGPIVVSALIKTSIAEANVDPRNLRPGDWSRWLSSLRTGLTLHMSDAAERNRCMTRLQALLATTPGTTSLISHGRTLEIRTEDDILLARGAGRELAAAVGFQATDQVKISTVISELARNITKYTPRGTIRVGPLAGIRKGIEIVAADEGPGIPHIKEVLSGAYLSTTGMGMGLRGSKRLMDEFDVVTAVGRGTVVTARKYLS